MLSPRRSGMRTAALCLLASTALLAAGSTPAGAAETAQDVVGASSATAVLLTLNLPGGAMTKVQLTLDPVSGTVTSTQTTTQQSTAVANATVAIGSLGGMPLDSGTSTAKLPSPKTAGSNPAGAIGDGINGTPLANLLKVEAGPTAASVTASPSSTSTAAVANLGAGLPDALAGALAPLLGPLADGVNQLLTTLSDQSKVPVAQLCDGVTQITTALAPVTGPLGTALSQLPIPVPIDQVVNQTSVDAICGLSDTIAQLNKALQDALASLTGDSGVFGLKGISSSQSITRQGGTITSKATASLAGLTLLGQKPFASVDALRTTSMASTAGTPKSATATVDSTVANLTGGSVDPFLQVRATINGIRDSFVGKGALPAALGTAFDSLFGQLNAALAPAGFTVFALDDAQQAKKITTCPSSLDGTLTGTLVLPDGSCAAAATRGVGLSLSLPAALAGPLMITGPLIEMQSVPTSAAVRAQVRAVAPAAIAAPTRPAALPRTGLDAATLGAVALLLVAGAAVLRRRRTSEL